MTASCLLTSNYKYHIMALRFKNINVGMATSMLFWCNYNGDKKQPWIIQYSWHIKHYMSWEVKNVLMLTKPLVFATIY